MVRINLLKANRKKVKEKKSGSPAIPVVLSIVIILLIGSGIGTWYLKIRKPAEKPVVVEQVQKTDFKPSTHVSPNMLEEVVKEVGDERQNKQKSGYINLSYEEMSFAEKINYEVFFSKNILDSLSKIIPSGVGFKILEIDNFTTMYSIGLGNNSAQVSKTFTLLKNHLGLLPQPYSYIKENGEKGFKFVITCKPTFGVDLVNSYQPIDHLFSVEELDSKLSHLSELAVKSALSFSGKPSSVTVEKIRDYKRFEYEWRGSGSYKNFVQFINSIYQEQLPCAFKSIHIKAKAGNSVDISVKFIFTVKE